MVHGFARRRPPGSDPDPVQRLGGTTPAPLAASSRSTALSWPASETSSSITSAWCTPALTHGDPKSAFIMGGGDGCSARELPSYAGIERIVVAELDPDVIESCRRQYFGCQRWRALDHPRSTSASVTRFAPARESEAEYDVIVMDLTDPWRRRQSGERALQHRNLCACPVKAHGKWSGHVAHRQRVLSPRALP